MSNRAPFYPLPILVCMLSMLATSSNAENGVNLANGLVGLWRFSGNAQDSSPSSNHATITGAQFAMDRFGAANSALEVTALGRWNAGGAYTTMTVNVTGNSSRTISYWTKFSAQGTGSGGGTGTYTQTAVIWGTNLGSGLCSWSAESTGGLWFNAAAADLDLRNPSPSVPFNEWKMITLTYSGLPRDAVMYVNGVANTNFTPGFWNPNSFNTVLNTVATRASMVGGQGDHIDDVRIYNRALSASEVALLYLHETYDPQSDLDNDGLTTAIELEIGTEPNNPDTDGDGLKDGAEYLLADLDFDPLVPNGALLDSLFVPSFYPTIEIFAPAPASLRISLGGADSVTASSVPNGWLYNTNTKQMSGHLAGIASFTGQLTATKAPGLNLPVTFNFHPQNKQSIGRFARVSGKKSNSPPFPVVPPTANSGLPVTLTVKSGPATISGNNIVTITGIGTVVLAANQPGNNNFLPAPEVTTSFKVTK